MEYGYNKTKVVWFPQDEETSIILSNVINISTKESFEPVNNKASIEFAGNVYDTIYENEILKLKENDKIVIYNKVVTDNSDYAFTDEDIIWTGKFVDNKRTISPDSNNITIEVLDYEYDVFSRFHKKTYVGLGMRTPFVLVDMIKDVTEDEQGTGAFKVSFKYVGYPRTDGIQVTRPNGGDQSAIEFTDTDITDNTTAYQNYTALAEVVKFPEIEPTMINKPTYEWVKELNSSIWTNTEDEQDTDTRILTKSMIFKIRSKIVQWYHPLSEIELIVDGNTPLSATTNSTEKEGEVNYLTLEVGEDFNGDAIFTYVVDEESTSAIQKERYDTQLKIAGKNDDYDNDYHSLRNQYTVATNIEFRKKVRELAKSFASYWFESVGRGKQSSQLTIPFKRVTLGGLIQYNLKNYTTLDYTIKSVSHNIGRTSSGTVLTLEEDIN